jgi:hypothetical protein
MDKGFPSSARPLVVSPPCCSSRLLFLASSICRNRKKDTALSNANFFLSYKGDPILYNIYSIAPKINWFLRKCSWWGLRDHRGQHRPSAQAAAELAFMRALLRALRQPQIVGLSGWGPRRFCKINQSICNCLARLYPEYFKTFAGSINLK